MDIYIESPISKGGKISTILIVIGILVISGVAGTIVQEIKAQSSSSSSVLLQTKKLATTQENSLLAISNPSAPAKPVQKIKVVVTGYSSTEGQTDSDPFITAAGTTVRKGIVANNLLPFGTKIRIPEIYGDEVFVVEDRMHWRKGYYHVDIWFSEYWQAKDFGAKRAYIEILES